jgi:hypothetical protein
VFPWKELEELEQRTINRVRRFLRAHIPMRIAAQPLESESQRDRGRDSECRRAVSWHCSPFGKQKSARGRLETPAGVLKSATSRESERSHFCSLRSARVSGVHIASAIQHHQMVVEVFPGSVDQPWPIIVRGGQKFIYVLYTGQTNDAGTLAWNRAVDYFLQMIRDQSDTNYHEGEESGRVMCLPLHCIRTTSGDRTRRNTNPQ